MTQRESLLALAVAYALTAAGLTWQFGPWGLIGSGIGLAALVLFAIDVKERHETVAGAAAQPRHRVPVHPQRPG